MKLLLLLLPLLLLTLLLLPPLLLLTLPLLLLTLQNQLTLHLPSNSSFRQEKSRRIAPAFFIP
ncbi:MAG: hypothetical protein PHG47_05750 [Sulfuricella sp.]|nr:hypothetical protein [Sulfuricella sp.]